MDMIRWFTDENKERRKLKNKGRSDLTVHFLYNRKVNSWKPQSPLPLVNWTQMKREPYKISRHVSIWNTNVEVKVSQNNPERVTNSQKRIRSVYSPEGEPQHQSNRTFHYCFLFLIHPAQPWMSNCLNSHTLSLLPPVMADTGKITTHLNTEVEQLCAFPDNTAAAVNLQVDSFWLAL